MVSPIVRIASGKDVKQRAKQHSPDGLIRCTIWGCFRPTQSSSGKGLSEVYCKPHQEHIRRHGHPTRRSYTVKELAPYRKAAREWLKQHRDSPYVKGAITLLDGRMATQGRPKGPDYQRAMKPVEKAHNTLAKLHEAGKTGEQLLEIVLTIKAAHSELGPHGAPDWEAVQIAKMAKRLRGASGTIQRNFEGKRMSDVWPNADSRWKRDWQRWPRAEGNFMRHLGRMIEEKAAYAIDGALSGGETIEEVKALRRKY